MSSEERNSFQKLLEFYSPLVNHDVSTATAEFKLWKTKLSRTHSVLKTSIDALALCDKKIFPNVHYLLKILCTLPVSTATPERTFSTLKRLNLLEKFYGSGRYIVYINDKYILTYFYFIFFFLCT